MMSPCSFYRRARAVTATAVTVIVLMALASCGGSRSGGAAGPSSGSAAGPSSRALMAGTVSATIDQSGGRLANQAGVALEVPKNLLRAPATASITPEPNGAWDVHIAAAWSGTVAVT